jgi:Helix-hairpin-helix motif
MQSYSKLAVIPLLVLWFASLSVTAEAKRLPSSPIDINTASQEQIQSLPGVGNKLAAKIIANRPYSSPSDLKKAGLPQKNIDKIAPLVTFGGASATGSSASAPASATSGSTAPATSSASGSERNSKRGERTAAASSGVAQTPPSPGMVWANPKTKIYHTAGDRFYGKTKHGQWMTEDDALKAGYRKSKQD